MLKMLIGQRLGKRKKEVALIGLLIEHLGKLISLQQIHTLENSIKIFVLSYFASFC